jgi:hypothetical protein
VLAEKVVKAPDVLPFTGADVTWLLSTGVLFVGLGGLLLAVAGWRQRRTT